MKGFRVLSTSLFQRLLAKLIQQHPDLPEVFESAIAIIETDPHNLPHKYSIKKLRCTKPGEGQYRLRVGRWRFRYDIWDRRRQVELSDCGEKMPTARQASTNIAPQLNPAPNTAKQIRSPGSGPGSCHHSAAAISIDADDVLP